MKKPLNYFGHAFNNPGKEYSAKFLKTKKGKNELKDEIKYRKSLRKELKQNGFDKSECWNLDYTFSMFILPRLKYFRENTISYPDEQMGFDGWMEILDKMIYAFERITEDDITETKEFDKVQEGLDLFGKYFRHLWI